ncbi:aldo/keto reductase [uncultured Bacteroides sp.]|jgi:2,5-didehydrogluconate reductase|uniref:aldo/keto reductase n=1 Tax=uncultured Bacteroides sp. TaxID=162156 RepID=UPI00280B4385|nr:aldo/keto reductase [uncultured Bacteroides sp.]
MEYVTLNNGIRMPLLGYGVYQMEDAGLCRRCVGEAIATGYRLIDTAAVYLNEEAVGKAVEVSGVPRSEFFITSKVWIQDMGYEQTLRAFDRSLARLGMDYLDLYLLHMPFGDVFGAWKAMERLYREGRVRAVGVCNFHIPRLADLMAHFEVVPAVNQVETHLFNQQQAMQRYAGSKGVLVEAWSPFAEGKNDFFRNETLTLLAAKYGKSVAQIALRWLTQRGIAAIPKSVHRERMEENFHSLDFRLSDEDMALIASCDRALPVVGDFDAPDFVSDLCGRKYAI